MEKTKTTPQQVEIRCQISDVRVEERTEVGGGRTITGYAVKFDSWSQPIMGWFVEQIRAGAFDSCDMTDAIMCFNHNVDDILARTSSKTLTLTVDTLGLKFSFDAPNTARGNDMVELISRGDINKCSFRFVVEKDEWLYADDTNGKKYDERTILAISKLYDVALVVYPAYKDTEASVRRLEERKAAYLESRAEESSDTGDGAGNETPIVSQEGTPVEEQNDIATILQSESRNRTVIMLGLKRKQ